MLLRAYSVYDECTETYGVPFFVVNDKTAERAFFMLVNDPQSTVFQSPKDFSLYFIGSYDDSNAELRTTTPVLIGRAPAYVQQLHLDDSPPRPSALTPAEESSHA